MRPGRGWLRFALVGLLTLAVVVGLGAWRVDQHSPIAWNRISVGEQIERHDVLLEVVSLGPTARPLEAVPGSV